MVSNSELIFACACHSHLWVTLYRSWPIVYILSYIIFVRSQPMRSDVTYVMPSLIGWKTSSHDLRCYIDILPLSLRLWTTQYFLNKYVHDLCFVALCYGFIQLYFTLILQDYFIGTEAIIWLPQCNEETLNDMGKLITGICENLANQPQQKKA